MPLRRGWVTCYGAGGGKGAAIYWGSRAGLQPPPQGGCLARRAAPFRFAPAIGRLAAAPVRQGRVATSGPFDCACYGLFPCAADV